MSLLQILVFIDNHQTLELLIDTGCILATGLLALAPLLKPQCVPVLAPERQVKSSLPWSDVAKQRLARFLWLIKHPGLFIALLSLSLFICRYPGFFYPRAINPDEAAMVAQAVTYESHPIPWRDIDGTSSGPLNSYVLLWAVPFGGRADYFSARVLQLALVLGTLLFLYGASRRAAGELAGRLAVLPTFAFTALTGYQDFTHYSSEVFSIFILGGAVYLLSGFFRGPCDGATCAILGFTLGLLPFAKLQSSLLGCFLGLTALVWLAQHPRLKRRDSLFRIICLLAGAIAPATLILSVVAMTGAFADFWRSYILMSLTYGSLTPIGSGWMRLSKPAIFAWLFFHWDTMEYFIQLSTMAAVAVLLQIMLRARKTSRFSLRLFVWALFFALTAVMTITLTGQPFVHYEFFFVPTLTCLWAALFRLFRAERTGRFFSRAAPVLFTMLYVGAKIAAPVAPLVALLFVAVFAGQILQTYLTRSSTPDSLTWKRSLAPACWILLFLIPISVYLREPNPLRGNVALFESLPPSDLCLAVLRNRPTGGRLAIWGWSPDIAAETQTALGTRDSLCPFQIENGPLQDYYRQRFLRDMMANRPVLFLDGTGPESLMYPDTKREGFETFPALAAYIAANYRFDYESDGMRLFVRKDMPTRSKP